MNHPPRQKSVLLPRCLTTLLIAAGLSTFGATSAQARESTARLLVAPRAGVAEAALLRALEPHGRALGKVRGLETRVLELKPGSDAAGAVERLRRHPLIEHVERDERVPPALLVDDPGYASSWALPRLGAPQAWDGAVGEGVVVAVLDTGVNAHPDLVANLVPGWNVYDDNPDTTDTYGHGTLVAGVVGMVANNGIGGAGLAWGARIMPVRIAQPDGYAYWSAVAEGITWAADHGARVVNISYANMAGSGTVQAAANYLRDKGGVVVVAAGNSGQELGVAPSDAVLAVSAVDELDALAGFSDYGAFVDLAAPGTRIYTLNTTDGYGLRAGTSFAAPFVAAAAALVKSANPALGAADVDAVLKAGCVDLGEAGEDVRFGAGRLDAAASVAAAIAYRSRDSTPPDIAIVNPVSGQTVGGQVAVDVSIGNGADMTRAELWVDGARVVVDSQAPFAFSWDTTPHAQGGHSLMAKAYDAAGNTGESTPLTVQVDNDTQPPVIVSLSPGEGATLDGNRVTLAASASDDQGVADIALYLDGRLLDQGSGADISVTENVRKLAPGAHQLKAVARDPSGKRGERVVTVYR